VHAADRPPRPKITVYYRYTCAREPDITIKALWQPQKSATESA